MEPQPSLISGVVRDDEGRPVAEARVYFTDGPVPLQDIAALTNKDGEFSLAAPAPGTYRIEAHADGYNITPSVVNVASGEEKQIEVKLIK